MPNQLLGETIFFLSMAFFISLFDMIQYNDCKKRKKSTRHTKNSTPCGLAVRMLVSIDSLVILLMCQKCYLI